jgi:CheY-like chemotaxis protein
VRFRFFVGCGEISASARTLAKTNVDTAGKCASLQRPLTEQRMPAKAVLIVEDNEDNRLIYETILRHHGYHVLTAVDGEEGLQLAQAHRPALVLLDISLPRMSGWDVASALLRDERTRHIVLVALTAHAYAEDRLRARALGFQSYLAKPVEPRRVIDEVERFIGPPDPPLPTVHPLH